MKQATDEISIETRGRGLTDITDRVAAWARATGIGDGLLTLFIRHTSASLLIQENADPDVLADLESFLSRLVPESGVRYRHAAERPDDMPAHIRAALTQTHLAIPVADARLALGTWQGVYVFEHRARPHLRTVALHLIGA